VDWFGWICYFRNRPNDCCFPKRCKIGGKLVLITKEVAYELSTGMKIGDLNGVMAVILRYYSEFGSFRGALRKSG